MLMDDFEALPRSLQLQIDEAFNTAVLHSDKPSPRKRPKLGPMPEPLPAGSFLLEDVPGGFVPPSEEAKENKVTSEDDHIPFSLIPAALQCLDLPPDDEDVLQVFRNAAGGWSSAAIVDKASETGDRRGTVSRKDWRAVCAVVVGSRDESTRVVEDVGGGFVIEDEEITSSVSQRSLQEEDDDVDAEQNVYEDEDEDVYEHSSLSSYSDPGGDSDSDSYAEDLSISKSKSKSNRTQPRPQTVSAPTSRQKRTALEAYSLFFPPSPGLSDDALAEKRLMYKDIVRVAGLLKEKIKAEKITEMLTLFSTSPGPDASMSFDDFARMMLMAKLA